MIERHDMQIRLQKRTRNPQLRAMAMQLGYRRFRGARKQTYVDMIMKEYDRDPERVTQVYNAVTVGHMPASGPSATDIQQTIDQRLKTVEDRLEERVRLASVGLTEEDRNRLHDEIIDEVRKEALESLKSFRPIEVRQPDGKRVRLKDVVLPPEFERMVQLASQRVNIMLVGPTGCGKTYVSAQLAKAIKARWFAALSCTAGMSESQLAGWLLPTGKNGQFKYEASPFVDIYENGGVFLLDEIDAADPNVLVFLNTAISGDVFHLPQRIKNPEVKKHKNFVLVCAANTFGSGADARYVGRNQIDAATLDRFRVGLITMDYSEKVERSVAAPVVYDWCIRVRQAIAKHGLRREMSTRTMVELTKMHKAYDWGEDDFAHAYFASWSSDEQRRVMEEVGQHQPREA